MKLTLDPLPHKDAARLIAGKPAVTRRVFDAMVPEIRARAFVITGVRDASLVQRVRDRIAEIPQGANWPDVRKDVFDAIAPELVTSEDPEEREREVAGAYRRAELLVRTHTFQAYAASSHNAMVETKAAFPYWQYQTMEDGAVRPEHAALNGLVLPADSPFWDKHFPPWDWGCRCEVIPLAPEDVEDIRAADEDRNPEDRLVLEGRQLTRLEQDSELTRGPIALIDPNDPERKREVGRLPGGRFDVRSPDEKAANREDMQAAFRSAPGDLRMPIAQIAERYDPETWKACTDALKEAVLPDGRTLLEWLSAGG
jgi:SPP1 gp7 family putative phage head morphogenesis protein